jgi:hypothetical protein
VDFAGIQKLIESVGLGGVFGLAGLYLVLKMIGLGAATNVILSSIRDHLGDSAVRTAETHSDVRSDGSAVCDHRTRFRCRGATAVGDVRLDPHGSGVRSVGGYPEPLRA